MAGVGVKLNRIFEKRSIAADLIGFTYSIIITIAPVLLVIGTILLMGVVLGFNEVDYLTRELFSCTILYTFVFGLLTVAPFNAVLFKYTQDAIYEERFQDILPCFYLGLAMNIAFSCLLGIPFLPVGALCRQSGSFLRVLRLLLLYFHGVGILFPGIPFCL